MSEQIAAFEASLEWTEVVELEENFEFCAKLKKIGRYDKGVFSWFVQVLCKIFAYPSVANKASSLPIKPVLFPN